MAFALKKENLKVRYSLGEQSLFALLPQSGAQVTSAILTKKFYGSRIEEVYNARKIIICMLASLMRKADFNKEPFRIKKTQRTGPIPISFYLEKRK